MYSTSQQQQPPPPQHSQQPPQHQQQPHPHHNQHHNQHQHQQHPAAGAPSMNGMSGGMMDDGTGTINPAALNTPPVASLPNPLAMAGGAGMSPRGIKRSRSPEGGDGTGSAADDEQRRKRGRPPKSRLSGGENELPAAHAPQQNAPGAPGQVPTPKQQMPPQPAAAAPAPAPQASPPKPAPPKTVVKALPTVRDHTTDQLTKEGDEYIPREFDEAGEKKVSPTGRPLEGREYRCRTFLVPNRGDKLFMLATECARVLGYRDSYLLFNKNRSLFKIIATQAEKDDLIGQEILPYSYRSRQIAIVTAKSMFRQFGSRLVVNGRRVRDDYWEAKARKQGFTEEDLAGEKRPGGQRAREAQAAEAAQQAAAMGHNQDVVYSSSGPGHVPMDQHGHPQIMQAGMGAQMGQSLAPLPMISLAPAEEMRLREFGNVPRPRQELAGQPYADRSQPSAVTEIMNHANHAADYNKNLNQQQRQRAKGADEYWKQPREIPGSAGQAGAGQSGQDGQQSASMPGGMPAGAGMASAAQQPLMSHPASQMMPQQYAQQQGQHPSQSPARGMHQGSYSYGQSHVWPQPPPNPQQSPMGSHPNLPQGYQHAGASHASPSPHASQSPHQGHPSQPPPLHHGQPQGQPMHGGIYQGMQGMSQYMPGRAMYGQQQQQGQQGHGSPPHAYMQQTSGGVGGSIQGWAPPSGQQGHGQQSWGNY